MESLVTGNRLGRRRSRQGEAQGHPLTRRRAWAVPTLGGAALLIASGAVHLYLYFNGYGPVPTIGDLFLLQFAACTVVGAAIVATSGFVAPAAGALLAMATLGGYLLSLTVRLFGFREVPTAYGAAAGGLELAAFAVLAAVSLARLLAGTAAAKRTLNGAQRAGLVGVPSLTIAATLALTLELLLVSPVAGAGTGGATPASGAPTVVAVRVAPFGTVLATPGHMALYLLSDEKPGHITCNSGCLSIWPPLLLGAHQRRPQAGAGMRGTLGVLQRGTSRQVTYNGFPLYTYAGDPGPATTTGQGIVSFGGTWYLVRASAKSRAATPVT
jgi:predicted lipoprotein with Yx(FWY)xxD motif